MYQNTKQLLRIIKARGGTWGKGALGGGGAGKIGDVSYAQVPSSRLRKTVIRVDEEEKK